MPREIVTETSRNQSLGQAEAQACRIQSVEICPAPECNQSAKDVKLFLNESKKYMKLFKLAYQRMEQSKKSLTYLLGWHHHMLWVSLAHHFLVRLRIQFQEQAPALTIYQVRILLCSVLSSFAFDIQSALERIRYYQQRNFIAYQSHRKKKLAQFDLFTRNLAL